MSVTDVINPATEAVVARVEQTSVEETDAAIARAHRALPAWKALAPADRARLLRRFAEAVDDDVDGLAELEVRSLATRGSLGGLPARAAAIINLVKQSTFDVIIVETVGVGQNEIEIASLSDVTVVVLVPESGDDIQFMKAGLMEIGDIFVVNKSDRPGADQFANEIKQSANNKIVVKTIANTNVGVGELFSYINEKIYS